MYMVKQRTRITLMFLKKDTVTLSIRVIKTYVIGTGIYNQNNETQDGAQTQTQPSWKLDPVRDSIADQWELDGPLNMVLVQGYSFEKL